MQLLKLGASGDAVVVLQQRLDSLGINCDIDGVYGEETERAVKVFQSHSGLLRDGQVGEETFKELGLVSAVVRPLSGSKVLAKSDIEDAAKSLGVDSASIRAVLKIESRGRGFIAKTASPVILFERHVMRRRLLANGVEAQLVKRYCKLMPLTVSRKFGGYKGGVKEYDRLFIAKAIDEKSALESCSWGLFQIMGYHWKALGYESVFQFVNCMKSGEPEHLKAFVKFVKNDPNLVKSLRSKKWVKFAARYNGPSYKRNNYGKRLARAYLAASLVK